MRLPVIVALAILCLPDVSTSQWVSFSDETGSRLTLTSVPTSDTQEKDVAVADFNRDGCLDLFQGLCTGWRGFIQESCIPPPTEFIRGDFDGDGTFNGLIDAVAFLDFQFQGGKPAPCTEASDADGDGTYNGLIDSLHTLNHQFQSGPPPAATYPNCGVDPDPVGSLGCGFHPGRRCSPADLERRSGPSQRLDLLERLAA